MSIRASKGFSLIEVLIGTAIFVLVGVAVIAGFTKMLEGLTVLRAKAAASNLVSEQFEIIRNMPYSQVGEVNGIPAGAIPSIQNLTRDTFNFIVNTTVRNIDDVFDGTISTGTPKDTSPADYKMVQLDVTCSNCLYSQPLKFIGYVSPKNLETASTNGALFVKVFDANGQPLQGAAVHVTKASSTVVIDDVTNNAGLLQIIDAPPGNQAYKISVTKAGYSTDQTYTVGVGGNTNPSKPDATVSVQQVTQASFSIDRTSTLSVSSVTPSCTVVPNIPFTLTGAKLIGTNPVIYKYITGQNTGSTGTVTLNNMEWDSYTPTVTSASYNLAGSNPLIPFSLNPASTQNTTLVVVPKDPSSVLIIVKDGGTGLPISGASVSLYKSGATTTLTTGQGYFRQVDWSSGAGQNDFTDPKKFLSSDGNIEINSPAGELKLKNTLGSYPASGQLTSSTFDTGLISNFQQLLWQPFDQPPAAGTSSSVRFQIATAVDNTASTTWNYTGPDGTASTYYSVLNQNIHSSNNGREFLRYKLFLSTNSSTSTPNISDISFTYTSSCVPPGQVLFNGLASGTYALTVSSSGYQTSNSVLTVGSTWQQKEILITP